ncbi:MAG: 30S ribosomal protein S16 [Patescibacteria group bacterium]
MLIIRYRRAGKRNAPQYKVVVAENSSPVQGKFVESLGSYNPHSKEVILKKERVKHWLEKGAQCSDSVHNLLVSQGILKTSKRKVNIPKKEEGATEEAVSKEQVEKQEAQSSQEQKEEVKEKEEKELEKEGNEEKAVGPKDKDAKEKKNG